MENKRKYKIVASDLDGTLLNKEQSVSEENFIFSLIFHFILFLLFYFQECQFESVRM